MTEVKHEVTGVSTNAEVFTAPQPAAAVLQQQTIRVVAQNVNSATLLVDNVSKTVSIRQGIVMHLSFLGSGITQSQIDFSVSSLLNAKVFSFYPIDTFTPLVPSLGASNLPELEEATAKKEKKEEEEEEAGKQSLLPTDTGATAATRVKPSSILEAGVDVLIVPQATLAGKVKGKVMQYHAQAPKDEGLSLYQNFVDAIRAAILEKEATTAAATLGGQKHVGGKKKGGSSKKAVVDCSKAGCCFDTNGVFTSSPSKPTEGEEEVFTEAAFEPKIRVLNGTFGNRQALHFDSPGPMSHFFDF